MQGEEEFNVDRSWQTLQRTGILIVDLLVDNAKDHREKTGCIRSGPTMGDLV
jgi:hypothetical protein